MQVVIIGPNLQDQSKGSFHVHAKGCADIRRDPKRYGYRLVGPHMRVDAESCADVAEYVYEDMIAESGSDADAYLDDFHFAPCVDALR